MHNRSKELQRCSIEEMSTLTWSNVCEWTAKNPHKAKTLTPYVALNTTVSLAPDHVDSEGWTRITVTPATPLSAVLMAQDAVYQASTEASRRSALRDETTDLQEKAIVHLKGRQWPVRRTAEGLSACGIEGRASSWPAQGWRAMAALRDCQIVVVNYDKKEVAFFPEDIRGWSAGVEIIWVDYECRYIWTKEAAKLSPWISERDTAGWTIGYPLADGTMEELKDAASKVGDVLTMKLNKEALRRRVGRSQSIKALLPI
jgi:hypothetical protein